MATGPIEFLGERPDQTHPATEYGGADGPIQPAPHDLTASEANNVRMRAAMRSEDGVDPVTGRPAP